MKTIPPPCPEPEVGPKYWRSLEQLSDSPEFNQWIEREFPQGASEFSDPVGRRHFIKIMSASFLLMGVGGLTGCRKPVEKILPFSKLPEGYIHGVAQFYATARPIRGTHIPLLVKSYEGRPVKIEGNPQHPSGKGGTDAFTQASILNLYDPDRAMLYHGAGNSNREEAMDNLTAIGKKYQATQGQGLAFLINENNSPSRLRLQKEIAKAMPQAGWYSYEPLSSDAAKQAAKLAYGKSVVLDYQFEKAKRILSLDSDFLGGEDESYRMIRGFAKGRKLNGATDEKGNKSEMSRFYAVEALYTVTGVNADHRLRVAPSQIQGVAARLAAQIVKAGIPGNLNGSAALDAHNKFITECAKDLIANGKSSVVIAGPRQPLSVHLLAHAMNAALGSEVVTARPTDEVEAGSISQLADALNIGKVETLVILGGNPTYNAPADLEWGTTVKKAKTIVRLAYYEDESFASATHHIPEAHYLEAWGDGRTVDGILVPVQPLIAPLFGGISQLEVLAAIAGAKSLRGYDIVRETFSGLSGGNNSEDAWKKFLHDGLLENSAAPAISGGINAGAVAAAIKGEDSPAPTAEILEVVFHRDYSVDDGRYNNNGWLQETPDPVTKIVWDNVIMLSPATARALKLRVTENNGGVPFGKHQFREKDLKNNDLGIGNANDVMTVTLNNRSVTGTIWVQPGMADNVLALALGYGRTKTGRIGKGCGYNAYLVRTTKSLNFASGAKLAQLSVAKTDRVVTTQEHGSMEGRPIVREANLEDFLKVPKFASHMDIDAHAPNKGGIYQHPYKSHPELQSVVHKWGMVIDLNSCVGCNACILACQSENNVPMVGKDQINKGREMQWLRLDRYYSGSVYDPQTVFQPMTCQHCESAPCESVCPVNATVHDEEGLNVMAYNRCIGTRYCANNCPYKVRRFNFFDFNKRPNDGPDMSKGAFGKLYQGPFAKREPLEYDLIKMLKNPDVTVRMRGVMEKCTFCVQRIEGAKITQKVKAKNTGDVQVPEGTFTTACAQACPAEAITFGNLIDENSAVSKLKRQDRNYSVLGFLDTKPRLTYLARIRNPNPALASDHKNPESIEEYIEADNDSPFAEHAHGAAGEHDKAGHANDHQPAHGAEAHAAEKGAK
ncbi:MAG: Fe-S-cluster-containing hydrogenase component 1-like protein [Verrucomicrobiales bacterium]|nr:Fe-S-cluster-containing hydrogenase component 1-like protein [Verrucomicrobiales bacterium]